VVQEPGAGEGGEPPSWKRREELRRYADACALWADLLASEGRYEEAVSFYTRALEVEPQNADLWIFKAITLNGGLGRDPEALACWERARSLDPSIRRAFTIPGDEKTPPVQVPAHQISHRGQQDSLRKFLSGEVKKG
jgi:tetratricopeptide (TPR) repeat protein